ncbi:MAG: putative entry exclusion protein TrbK-alt [Xanthobacteraceae bacterium]|nr:putative entry exclusion protein TrbK-alt [Xanthobacteraceae bacterium]
MDSSTSKKLIALIVIGVILAGAAAWMATTDRPSSAERLVPDSIGAADPLQAEFARCQGLGEAGAHDPACLAAWAENRRRFLAPDRRPAAPNPAVMPMPTEGR